MTEAGWLQIVSPLHMLGVAIGGYASRWDNQETFRQEMFTGRKVKLWIDAIRRRRVPALPRR